MLRPLKIVYEYFALYSSLTLLGLICLSWSVFALPLFYILPQRLGTAVGRRGIMSGFRLYAWSLALTRAYYLDLQEIDSLKGGPPLILAPNHPCLIDALLILTRHPNIVCVMKSALMRNVFLGAGSRLARYVRNDSSRQMVRESVAHLHDGAVLLLFPEGTRTLREPINELVGSVGLIAKHANVPVQTLVIETDSPFLSKGWPLFRRPSLPITYRVRLGKRFDPPSDVAAFTAELDAYYRQALAGALQSRWLSAATLGGEMQGDAGALNGPTLTWCSYRATTRACGCLRPCAARLRSGHPSGWSSMAAPINPPNAYWRWLRQRRGCACWSFRKIAARARRCYSGSARPRRRDLPTH